MGNFPPAPKWTCFNFWGVPGYISANDMIFGCVATQGIPRSNFISIGIWWVCSGFRTYTMSHTDPNKIKVVNAWVTQRVHVSRLNPLVFCCLKSWFRWCKTMIPSAIRFHSMNMYPPKKRSFTRYLFILGPNRRGLEKKMFSGCRNMSARWARSWAVFLLAHSCKTKFKVISPASVGNDSGGEIATSAGATTVGSVSWSSHISRIYLCI